MKGNIAAKTLEPKKMRVRETTDELSGWSPEQWVQGVTRMRRGVGTPGDP